METWRLNSLVSHGKNQGQRTSLVSQDKIHDERDVARDSLVSHGKSQGQRTSLVSQDKSQDKRDVARDSLVSHGKSQGQCTILVSQDKSQDERDVSRDSLVKSWQESRQTYKPCEPRQKSGQKLCEPCATIKVSLVSLVQNPRQI
jgi:hypothetical protein